MTLGPVCVSFHGSFILVRFCCIGLCPNPEAVLSFHQLVENSDESFLLDNEALPLGCRYR